MALHNFTAADLEASLLAAALFPLVVLIPGYSIARLLDLFEFRKRTMAFRLVLAVPLSIALCPVITFLVGHLAETAMWGMYAGLWIYFAATILRDLRSAPKPPGSAGYGVFAAIGAAWLAVSILSLVDLQIGNRNYYSILALDYALRTSFIQSISATGIPPHNPFFFPGHGFPLRYHYFWLILCSLTDRLGGQAVNPRQAMIGGTFWCGIGFMAVVALYLRLFSYQGAESFRRRARIGILLVAVTGLDLIPTLFIKRVFNMVLACMDWWNEQVTGLVSSLLWEPHYMAGLVACLTGFLLLWDAPRRTSRSAQMRHAVAGGVALASGVGASIYVSFVFAVFLVFWTAVTVAKKWRDETKVLVVAGLVCVVLAAPYLMTLRGPSPSGTGPPLTIAIRSFKPVESFIVPGPGQGWKLAIANALLLPVNYFLELGFFLAAGLLWLRSRRARGEPLTRPDLALALMIGTSILICTFLRSSVIANNDLGWRGFLVAQFGLVLCGVEVLTSKSIFQGPRKAFLVLLLVVGVGGTLYDVSILRLYPVLADRGLVGMPGWMAPDRRLGARTYAVRAAYEWAERTLDVHATVQYDPHVIIQDTPAFYYADRAAVAGNEDCLATFGGDPALCDPMVAKLNEIYPTKGSAPASLADVCGSLPLDVVVAKDSDPVWRLRSSWVWQEKPVFANHYVRMFRCSKQGPAPAVAQNGAH